MKIQLGVTGKRRKQLVNFIGDTLGLEPVYKGAPSFAYSVGNLTFSNDGILTWDERTDGAIMEDLLNKLREQRFVSTRVEGEQDNSSDTLTIELPLEGLSETALENLRRLVDSKASLIKKALAAESVEIEVADDKVRFPWFGRVPSPEEISAYTRFVLKLVAMAKSVKRVNAREKDVDNEKYAMRTWLLRLGYIGDEYKEERKILLSRLEGNAAFKNQPADLESGVDGE